MLELHNLKNPKILWLPCIRINEIENQADDVYHRAISDLFENEKDAIELIKISGMLASGKSNRYGPQRK